jgi:hypothetical protein
MKNAVLEGCVKWKDIIEVDRKEGKHRRKWDVQTVLLAEIRTGYFLDAQTDALLGTTKAIGLRDGGDDF